MRPAAFLKTSFQIDAFNIDLKGFSQSFYDHVSGDPESGKRFRALAAGSRPVEMTTLILPGKNDSAEEIDAPAEWIACFLLR